MTGTPTDARPGVPEPLEDEASYGTRVEEAFIEERGTPFFLLPKDWQLIKGWREAGIPSDTVIRAVRAAFEKKRARGDVSKISSLSYCANAVEVLWEMERRGLVGAHGPRPVQDERTPFDGAQRLRELAEALRGGRDGRTLGGRRLPGRRGARGRPARRWRRSTPRPGSKSSRKSSARWRRRS